LLSHHVVTLLGERVLIRPLKRSDAALYPDFLTDVTQADLRLRFFSVMRELSADMIDKLVHYDVTTAMAFAAIEENTGRLLGVVRLHGDDKGETAEFAILLRTHLKGHGLGWLMMKHMIANAKAKGLKFVRGQVLAENTTMLQMCGELGFHAVDDPLERGVKDVTLPLDEVPEEATA
jgi:acetyltransferase